MDDALEAREGGDGDGGGKTLPAMPVAVTRSYVGPRVPQGLARGANPLAAAGADEDV